MTNAIDSKTGPPFRVGDSCRTWDDNDHRKGYMEGKVTGASDEGITVKWDDLEDETNYGFGKVTIQNDLIIEHGCPWPPETTLSVWEGQAIDWDCIFTNAPVRIHPKTEQYLIDIFKQRK